VLNAKLNEAIKTDKLKEAFAKLGVDPAGGAPSVLARLVDTEIKKWVKVATEKNIKVEP
jgi:tripartite-type tricarboxylate transporter receptor subunit TctC